MIDGCLQTADTAASYPAENGIRLAANVDIEITGFTLVEPLMPYFALLYHTSTDYVERRAQYRADHLALARDAHARGELLLAGALQNPVDAALLVWKCADRAPIHAFIDADPYIKNGLVTRWEIRDWYVVIADDPMPV